MVPVSGEWVCLSYEPNCVGEMFGRNTPRTKRSKVVQGTRTPKGQQSDTQGMKLVSIDNNGRNDARQNQDNPVINCPRRVRVRNTMMRWSRESDVRNTAGRGLPLHIHPHSRAAGGK